MADIWDDLTIEGNSIFVARQSAKEEMLETRFFTQALRAAEDLQRQELPVIAGNFPRVWRGVPMSKLVELLGTNRFKNACREVGIDLSADPRLSPRMLAMAAIYLDTSNNASLAQKLRMGGVSRSEWDGWLLQPAFSNRLSVLAEERVRQLTPLAEMRLEQAVDRGEPWAIQYGLALTKRFDPRSSDMDPAAAIREIQSALDAVLPQEMLQRVLEYVQAKREGRDPEVVAITVAPSSLATATLGESAPPS